MATLSHPKLTIKLLSGTTNAEVTATIDAALTAFEKNLVKLAGLKFKLKSRLRGSDSGFNGADDELFTFPGKTVTADGNFKFAATVSRETLDEDWGNDEVYARFTLQSVEPIFPFSTSKDSPTISGNF